MKKIIFPILIFVFSLHNALAQKRTIEVGLDPRMCANCTSGLYSLLKDPAIDTIFVVFLKKYQSDTTELEEEYGFKKYKKIRVRFSDFPGLVTKDGYTSYWLMRTNYYLWTHGLMNPLHIDSVHMALRKKTVD